MKIRKHYKSFKKAWLYEISSITSRLNSFGSMFKSRLIWTRHICWDLCQLELYPFSTAFESCLWAHLGELQMDQPESQKPGVTDQVSESLTNPAHRSAEKMAQVKF